MSNTKVGRLVSRTIDGIEALVGAESGEIFIDVPAENAHYIRVEEGDTIQEGDVRSHTEEELASSSLRKWTIETIGRESVTGTDQETGERHEWERESLERKLANGGLSTDLTDFERVTVLGESKTSNREGGRSDEESVRVAVYGNDGRKFTNTYHIVDDAGGDERRLELTDSDTSVEQFDTDLRERFERAVEHALENEGYEV